MKIADIFAKPIDRPIEEVIKVSQDNRQAVLTEITEYVATDAIRDQFVEVFTEVAEGATRPREGIGIWVSGFFGSGKSSFAKLLGYTIANRQVGGESASALFKRSVEDPRISNLLDSINARIPFEAVIFDVSMERTSGIQDDKLTTIIYRQLLKQLNYAEDFDLAELEIALEGDGRLERFEAEFERLYNSPWRRRRSLGLAINEASATLHRLDPATYSTADSYAVQLGSGRAQISPEELARRTFELCKRRAPGKAIIFIVDEVGQYVSRSVDKMLDLMGIVQSLGVMGRNLTEKREALSPCWLVVTAQEKLDEVVTALDSRQIELARLVDRFRITVDLKQSDITEITSKRVLAKKSETEMPIGKLYDEYQGRLASHCRLESSSRNLTLDRNNFVRLYPYLPYQIDLCIDIVSGLRVKRGAHRHVGGSNRTIIKQAQEMMINERTGLGKAALGRLVTLDLVYELLEAGNLLPVEVSREVSDVKRRLPDNAMALRVVKAIALLEPVKDLPRTVHNIAVVLHSAVDAPSCRAEVETALKELEQAQFVRNSDEGYKLLTTQEKQWDTERNALTPREAERNAVHRDQIGHIFSRPGLSSISYNNTKTFSLGVVVDGLTVREATKGLALNITLATAEEWDRQLQDVRNTSVNNPHGLYWMVELTPQIRDLVTEFHRSKEMIAEAERKRAQQQLAPEEATSAAAERNRRDSNERKLGEEFLQALQRGTAFTQGVEYAAGSLGTALTEMVTVLVKRAVPVIYPKLGIGNLKVTHEHTEKLLTAANLSGLPRLFYSDKPNESLVIKQGDQYVPNMSCDLVREIKQRIDHESSYGNKNSGKSLEEYFAGNGYGWDIESLRLGLALLFRGGAVNLTGHGRCYSSYTEPLARQILINTPNFRHATFTPRKAIDLKTLTSAANFCEQVTGREVNIEEAAIAKAFKAVAEADQSSLVTLVSRLEALKLPGAAMVREQLDWLYNVNSGGQEECVSTLATEGQTFIDTRRRCAELQRSVTEANIAAISSARQVLVEQWPLLESRGVSDKFRVQESELRELLESDECLQRIETLKGLAEKLHGAYRQLYTTAFTAWQESARVTLEGLKGRKEWLDVAANPEIHDEVKQGLLERFERVMAIQLELPQGATLCRNSRMTVGELESQTTAMAIWAQQALHQMAELLAPGEQLEHVAVSHLYPGRISNEAELAEFIESLRTHLSELLDKGNIIVLD